MPFNLEKTGVIYILVDPRNDEVRYVGATQNPGQRKRKHMSGSDMATGGWVTELIRLGLLPRFEIAHEDVPGEMLERIEAEEINERSKSGSVLLNQSCMVWANKWRNFAEMVERKIRLGGTDAARAYREIAEYRSRYRRDMDIYRPSRCLLLRRVPSGDALVRSGNGSERQRRRPDHLELARLARPLGAYAQERRQGRAVAGEFHGSLPCGGVGGRPR